MLGAELAALAAAHPTRFTLMHTLSRPKEPAAWQGCTGRVCAEMVAARLSPAREETGNEHAALAFLCGPGGLPDSCFRHLYALCYADDRVLAF